MSKLTLYSKREKWGQWLLLLSGVHLGSSCRFGLGFRSPYCFSSGMVEVGFREGAVCHGENKHVDCLMAETKRSWKVWVRREKVAHYRLLN